LHIASKTCYKISLTLYIISRTSIVIVIILGTSVTTFWIHLLLVPWHWPFIMVFT